MYRPSFTSVLRLGAGEFHFSRFMDGSSTPLQGHPDEGFGGGCKHNVLLTCVVRRRSSKGVLSVGTLGRLGRTPSIPRRRTGKERRYGNYPESISEGTPVEDETVDIPSPPSTLKEVRLGFRLDKVP